MDPTMIEGGALSVLGAARGLRVGPDGAIGLGDGTITPDFGGGVAVGGRFRMECYDREGNLRWVDDLKNGVTNQALNLILDQVLRNQAGISQWYLGLMDNAGFSAFAASDVPNSHPGWVENTDYSAATRPPWSPGAASGQAVTNSVTVDFAMNPVSAVTIRGLFLISANDKGGGASGQKLFSTAAFSGGNQTVNNGDTLKVTYTVSAASS
jgi:hypothetical protein